MLISHIDKKSKLNIFVKLFFIFIFFVALFFFGQKYFKDYLLLQVSNIQSLFVDNKIKDLENQVFELTNRLALYQISEDYESDANRVVELGLTDFYRSNIILPATESIYKDLTIAGGYDHNLYEGALVFNKNMEVIGSLNDLSPKFSKLTLYTKSNNKVNVVYKNSSSTEEVVELIGDGAYGFVGFVSSDSDVEIGQDLYLGDNSLFKVARVVEIVPNENENNKLVRAKGFYSPRSVNQVYIQK